MTTRPATNPQGVTAAIYAEHRICGPKYTGCYSHSTFTEHCRADGMAWPCDVDALRADAAPWYAENADYLCFGGLSPEAAAEHGIKPHVVCPDSTVHERTICAACGQPPRPSLVTVENALDEAWLESHDARSIARPPDLAEHLHEALLDYIAIEASEGSES